MKKKAILLIITISHLFSCGSDYWEDMGGYDFMSENGWKNENFKIETSWIQLDFPPEIYDANTQYFKWYRHDTLFMEGYVKEIVEKHGKPHEAYSLVRLSNGYLTEFKKILLSNDVLVLDTKWPRKTKDSLALFEYERLNHY